MIKMLERYEIVINGHISLQNTLGALKFPTAWAKNIGKYVRRRIRSDIARLQMKMSWQVREDLFLAKTVITKEFPNNPRTKILE